MKAIFLVMLGRGALETVGTIAMKLSAETLNPYADANRSAAQNVFETLSCMTESTEVRMMISYR